jgi:FMN phosphatase YigB (HAD superfamily)|tara:strand:- start:52 stop:642 length:591 start_codon:yes stop_codon:yes gene_type:complete
MSKSLIDLLEAYPLPEQENKPPYKLYCDMDGVLTDFERRFHDKLNTVGKDHYPLRDILKVVKPKDFEAIFGSSEFWKFIDQIVGVGFWAGMPWMQNGQDLWNFISKYNPELLTSPSRDNTSRLGKQLWAKKHLNPKPKVIFAYSADKQRYANENSILIDDKPSNIEQWRAAGGIAFRVKNGDNTEAINGLKELGYE